MLRPLGREEESLEISHTIGGVGLVLGAAAHILELVRVAGERERHTDHTGPDHIGPEHLQHRNFELHMLDLELHILRQVIAHKAKEHHNFAGVVHRHRPVEGTHVVLDFRVAGKASSV